MRETEAEVYVNGDDNSGGDDGDGSCGCDSDGADGNGGSDGSGSGDDDGGSNNGGNGNDSDDDDDEKERKLSIVEELPELLASPPMSLAMCQTRERSQTESRHDSDQVTNFLCLRQQIIPTEGYQQIEQLFEKA